ncbi:MAG: MipA/OmpV family protein [Gammaproteobacteria bacterium]|nr:MipA/OmpV family protein [Gammaproteobacteria bacterium]
MADRCPRVVLWILFSISLFWSTMILADHVPGHAKLEWGIGVSALSMPDYRGSSENQDLIVPFPFIKYRGERLRVDEGIEGRLFKTPNLLLSISGNGSLPSSEDNQARQGMEELDASFELGPSLEYRLNQSELSSLWLEIPLRFAYTIDGGLDSIGRVFHPRLAWRHPAPGKQDWKLRFAAGPLYADDTHHGYYYNVNAQDATPDRPVFTAKGGYSGLRADFTFSRRFGRLWFGGFIRYDDISDSDITDSPLVEDEYNLTAGLGLAFVISER